VVRRMAPQVPDPVRHRAVPSIHHASRLTAVNEVAWKPVGIGPPGGPTTGTGAVVVAGLVVELDGLVVVEATVVAEVEGGEAVVLPHAAPVRARAVTATPARAPANGVDSSVCPWWLGAWNSIRLEANDSVYVVCTR
jgi:hypothetical protein